MDMHEKHLGLKLLTSDSTSAQYSGVLNPAHPYIDGHFDGFPVFPAVGQLTLVEDIASVLTNQNIEIADVTKAKFRSILKPGATFTLNVQVIPEKFSGAWQMVETSQRISEGHFTYHVTR